MKASLLMIFSLFGLSLFGNAESLSVGADAPTPTALDQEGKSISFKSVYDKGPTLVFFFPKADTPGCTKQACSIRDDWNAITAKGIQVLGVSGDKVDSQKKFQDKYQLPFPLIADSDGTVMKAFGVPSVFGISKRQSFLIQHGKIVWVMPAASTANHSKDVLEAFDKLKK